MDMMDQPLWMQNHLPIFPYLVETLLHHFQCQEDVRRRIDHLDMLLQWPRVQEELRLHPRMLLQDHGTISSMLQRLLDRGHHALILRDHRFFEHQRDRHGELLDLRP